MPLEVSQLSDYFLKYFTVDLTRLTWAAVHWELNIDEILVVHMINTGEYIVQF